MSRAKDLEAGAAALLGEPAPVVAKAPAPRKIPFKMTVLLSGDLRRILKDYPERMHLPDHTGKAVIPGSEVIRALIRELETNGDLQVAIAKRIQEAVAE